MFQMKSVNTVLTERCLLHYMIGWRNSTNHYKQVDNHNMGMYLYTVCVCVS